MIHALWSDIYPLTDIEKKICISPLVTNGLSHPYHLDESTFIFRGIRSNFAFLLAHLSQRLIGELIGYPWFGVVVHPSTISNVFSETAWPIKAKFYVEPHWEGGMKVYINGPGHMTKMTFRPIYGKNLKKSSSPEPDVL